MAKKDSTPKPAANDKLERHPLSEKYGPKMGDEELLGLGTDIKAHGQHDDIILHEGKVLAGWNRYMGCLQQGLKPRTKPMAEGADPVAVAFGTNFVRRRLSSVQKAFYGAQFSIDNGAKQVDVAKLVGCNINRLNQCVQLLKLNTDASNKVVDTLRTNPEVTPGAFEEMLLECGITRASPAPGPARTGTFNDDDDDGLGDLTGGDDDLTGGAIDGLLGDEDPGDETSPNPATRKPKGEIGEGSGPLPTTGSKPGSLTNPHETQVSRIAKAFRKLDANEQRQFVKFAWAKLHAALNAAINGGDVKYTAPDVHEPTPAPSKGKKASGKAPAKSTPPDPSIIARGKPVEDDTLTGKTPAKKAAAKKAAPAAKKTAPAKKAAAKKGGK